ncbi:MAG TPA: DUF4332 domain-containing protein [Aggregatilinea sp.]|uniref:DUF4332 domain-containing protein n=1 Tax=Aggregatilinea sp. TaxID=2806333 RepID=UPI002BCF614F|nr:DUF4332 domain-containing protein [Aggregatilinea sp.]HML22596.1 DUF4332 domain-containing protein [Aggregatilinea sp.]
MYAIDLAQISLDEFETIIATADLLPGRRILADDLSGVMARMKRKGINDLGALQKLLRNKRDYPALAAELSVSVDYLTVLNREINSYVSKPVPLASLDLFSEAELARFDREGLKSSKDLYERGLTRAAREELAASLHLEQAKIEAAVELADLLRINGVGPVYAKILREMGINSAAAYAETASEIILERYCAINTEKGYSKARLSLKDVEYCKRFCRKLDVDIQK